MEIYSPVFGQKQNPRQFSLTGTNLIRLIKHNSNYVEISNGYLQTTLIVFSVKSFEIALS
jgi:hypothetical protein